MRVAPVTLFKRGWANLVHPTTRFLFRHTPLSFDHAHGVDTGGIIPTAKLYRGAEGWCEPVHRTHFAGYEPTQQKHFRFAVSRIPGPPEAWSFVDVGAGKGRAVLLALAYPFRRVIGVELDPGLHAVALQNLRRYRGPCRCADVELILGDATRMLLPPGDIAIFFYNSFTGEPLRAFLDHLEAWLRASSRRLLLLYSNPVERGAVDGRPAFTLLFDGVSPRDFVWWGNRRLVVYGAGLATRPPSPALLGSSPDAPPQR